MVGDGVGMLVVVEGGRGRGRGRRGSAGTYDPRID